MFQRNLSVAVLIGCLVTPALADEVLHRYEGDVHPLDPSTGWILNQPCEDPCTAFVEDGHFVLQWAVPGLPAGYTYWINIPPEPPPLALGRVALPLESSVGRNLFEL